MAALTLSQLATSDHWQTNFAAVLPVVQTHASIQFRHLQPEALEEATAETVARACFDYDDLVKRHRLGHAYPSTLATYAVQRVRAHRCVGGHQNAKDVLSPVAQARHGFALTTLTPWDVHEGSWREVVVESKRVNPADSATFRVDFADWLGQWPKRHRRIINALAAGHRAMVVAQKFGMSQGRVSQLRRHYQRSWEVFQGEQTAAQVA